MFLHGHFTLPITIGTTVGAKGIKKRANTNGPTTAPALGRRVCTKPHNARRIGYSATQENENGAIRPANKPPTMPPNDSAT